ncbi:WD repeat-containing protein 91 [Lamellibrachia satsuma]|nr:WD repeat-containing protein 91 [Lamellibrachia satsuma]
MANTVGRIDELVTEYLLYRGFHSAAKFLESDSKNARDKGFRVDKILDQIHVYIANNDLQGLIDYWHFLDRRLFSHLVPPHEGAVHKLEISLFKMYVISAAQNSKQDKVSEFFEKMTPQLQGQPVWSEWFVLPFLKSPEEHRPFTMYFTKQWQDTFYLSLHNFLSAVIPLLSPGEEQKKLTRLREENARYKQQLTSIAETKPLSTHSISHDRSTDASSGGMASELMDDFFIISQEREPQLEKSQPKSQQLKSFIRNIAMPPSPILGKKPATAAAAAALFYLLCAGSTQAEVAYS